MALAGTFLALLTDAPALFAKVTVALSELLAARYRTMVEEMDPVRALAASLRHAGDETPRTSQQAVEILRKLAPGAGSDDPEL